MLGSKRNLVERTSVLLNSKSLEIKLILNKEKTGINLSDSENGEKIEIEHVDNDTLKLSDGTETQKVNKDTLIKELSSPEHGKVVKSKNTVPLLLSKSLRKQKISASP